jgi:acyl carrier protein
MESKSINGRTVREVVAAHACVNVDEVTPASNPRKDLGLDSLDNIELCMKLEREFDVAIEDAYWETCDTVQDIENLINTLRA